MTTVLNGMDSQVLNRSVVFQNKNAQTSAEKFSTFLQGQFKVGGLFGDFANALKLMNFWTESITGSVTESSRKMTEAGSVLKNYIGALEFPSKVASIQKNFAGLNKGTVESVAEFANSIFCAGKSFLDGVELAGSRFGMLSKETVKFFSPLSPIGTFSFAATELTFKNIPELKNNWEGDRNQLTSTLMKVAKNISLFVVGSLALVAAFFRPICQPWVIPALLTVYITNSIAARFFDGLILPAKNAI